MTELEALGVVWAVKHFRPYLYGHKCLVITDHEALKSLLNTPHPCGKLARWGLAIQELDLVIQYRPGKKNQSADALSRMPTKPQEFVAAKDREAVINSLASDDSLGTYQDSDMGLRVIKEYLKDGKLPSEDRVARELVLSREQYKLIDDVLYHVEPDKPLRVIPPVNHRKVLFDEVHSGLFGAHLRIAKIRYCSEVMSYLLTNIHRVNSIPRSSFVCRFARKSTQSEYSKYTRVHDFECTHVLYVIVSVVDASREVSYSTRQV